MAACPSEASNLVPWAESALPSESTPTQPPTVVSSRIWAHMIRRFLSYSVYLSRQFPVFRWPHRCFILAVDRNFLGVEFAVGFASHAFTSASDHRRSINFISAITGSLLALM